MDYLNRLNAEQLDAVRTTEGPVRVIAGAGTGKTGALTAWSSRSLRVGAPLDPVK